MTEARTLTLADFLLARIAEDEAKIEHMQREKVRTETAQIFRNNPPGWLSGVDIFVSPDRWRAECEAKRRIIEYALPFLDVGFDMQAETVLRLLALPYADHADYRPEWRP